MGQQLRARFDVIVVLDVDDEAVQFSFATNLRDQLELTRRFPKAADEPGSATARLVYCAAQRTGCSPEGEDFEAFVDRVLDLQLDEAPPLRAG